MSAAASKTNDGKPAKKYIYKMPPPGYSKRKPIAFMPMPKLKPHKVWTWSVMVTLMSIIVFFLMNKTKEKTFARHRENLQLRTHFFDCSPAYRAEMQAFPACAPERCGRLVTDDLLQDHEVDVLLELAQSGLALGGSSGGASILDLHSGALSRGNHFVNVFKQPGGEELFRPEQMKVYESVQQRIAYNIAKNFGISEDALHLTSPTFFSRITDAPAQTLHDEYWHPHVDKQTYASFHYTSLVYLSGYKRDFTGGRFVFIDGADNKTHSIVEPKRGRVIAFTSGAENLHQVEMVGSGTRFAITISFTCDPKHAIYEVGTPERSHMLPQK